MTAAGITNDRTKWSRRLLPVSFVLYLALLAVSMYHHELWGDELHSWNFSKGSDSYPELIRNIRYEGHPPVWYSLLWLLSKCTHEAGYIQWVQFVLAAGMVLVLLFYAPLPLTARLLLPFGYYFLYEYGTFSRNYAVGVLTAFLICMLLSREHRRIWLYYLLLLLLANTHMIGTILATGLHLYYLYDLRQKGRGTKTLLAQGIAGAAIILLALYLIFPPSGSSMDMMFWFRLWNKQRLQEISVAPLKSFAPIPAWWEYHFWNTQFLLELQHRFSWVRWISYLLSFAFIALAIYILRPSRKALLLFIVNLLLTLLLAFIFPLTSIRYVGFLYISFLVACWLSGKMHPVTGGRKKALYFLLCIPLAGSAIAVTKDTRYPFSNAWSVKGLIHDAAPGIPAVSDGWCLNNVLAYVGAPFYCIELNKPVPFLLWDKALAKSTETHHMYQNGLDYYFHTVSPAQRKVCLCSANPPQLLQQLDPGFFVQYQVRLIAAKEGAIEKSSDIYLYEVSVPDR